MNKIEIDQIIAEYAIKYGLTLDQAEEDILTGIAIEQAEKEISKGC